MTIAQQYIVEPAFHLDNENLTKQGDKTNSTQTTYAKNKRAEFAQANSDKEIVPADWYAETMAVVQSLYNDPEANTLFNAPGPVELTLVWNDPETGILCKGRIDKAVPTLGRFADLKTTQELAKFSRHLANYNYHRQMAHYQAGWAVLNGGELLEPWICAVEKEPPYCVQTAPIEPESIDEGERQRRELLRTLHECLETDEWPGPPSPDAWRIPTWAFSTSRVVETETEVIAV